MDMQIAQIEQQGSNAQSGARRTVRSYGTYAEAQRAVDYLSDHKFPVERVAIVAEGLKLVEQVTGRLTYGRVAVSGALSGAVMGALFGFIFGLFNWIAPLISPFVMALYGVIYGMIIGTLMSVIFYALSGGKRDFSSYGGLAADRYNVMVDAEVASEAMRMLGVGQPPLDRENAAGSSVPQAI
jgi:hypothetical protein